MDLNISLLAFTPEPEYVICKAAHVCYSNLPINEIDASDSERMIQKLIGSGHLSPLEHANFTFAVEGISIVCLKQLTRHRLASYSVRSQRYVPVEQDDFVTPRGALVEEITKRIGGYRSALDDGLKKEDARYALPQAVTTALVLTMNARELLHFFRLRCCHKAQWEIRQLACAMLETVKTVAPNIFKKAGAACVQDGFCREAIPCGKVGVPHLHFLFDLYDFWKEQRNDDRQALQR